MGGLGIHLSWSLIFLENTAILSVACVAHSCRMPVKSMSFFSSFCLAGGGIAMGG